MEKFVQHSASRSRQNRQPRCMGAFPWKYRISSIPAQTSHHPYVVDGLDNSDGVEQEHILRSIVGKYLRQKH